ncbi:phage regulatory CII family protein [Desulfovibrio gilichinskyi]|uniref:Amino acid-binding protein n=1 Tax=Desulfovibrio gilichinskyi TaxID=1519643 RepID=A0A1X7C4Z1_9BACT|nr:phage regulatory CII family protein [Desulfovibrio gilichinskyi]SME90094.1 hypothetical protein SAMN06295933_0357 [Desulfovibrio gilichinskyi]
MPESITKMTQDIVLEGNSPAKEVAKKIGKPYSTLLREINPFDNNAKLGARTLLDILKVTNDVKLLEQIANSVGYTIKPRGEQTA